MSKKYFFFDIDGTLTNKNPGGEILPSTLETLKKLKDNGHFVALATGRSQKMAEPFAESAGIENMVTDGGNGLTIDKKLIYQKPLEHQEALKVIEECLEKNVPFCLTIDNTLDVYGHTNDFIEQNCNGAMEPRLKVVPDLNYHDLDAIHKIFVGLTPEEEHTLVSLQGKLGFSRYHREHLIIEPEDKFDGIRSMMEYLNAPLEDVVVFGDASNDLSMMKEAAFGVAMGNAIAELKAIADYVTKDCDDNGIEHACQKFGWI